MRDVLTKMREISQNAGFPATIAGRLTPMPTRISQHLPKPIGQSATDVNIKYITSSQMTHDHSYKTLIFYFLNGLHIDQIKKIN